jgi:heat shock protein HslJ
MNPNKSLARFIGAIVIVSLLCAACAPIPLNPPRIAPTESVLIPNVSSGASESPLQSTALPAVAGVMTSTVAVTLTTQVTSTVPTTTPLPTMTPAPSVEGPTWEWVSSTFKDGTVLAPGDPSRYSFQLLGDGNATVQADCNFGSATYVESGNSLVFDAVGTTKMACPPDSMDSAFLAQLRNAQSYAFEEDQLVLGLKNDAGTMRLRLAPGAVTARAEPPLEATPTPLPTDTPRPATPTPLPPPTGTATAPASLSPVTSAPPAATPTPRPVVISTPVPLPTAAEAAMTNPPISGTSWLLVSLTANGQAIPPVGSTPISLEVDPAGTRVSGSTGCNLYRAILNNGTAGPSFQAPALMTAKACAAPLMVQEVEFIDSLLRTRSYQVLGNELTLLDAAGNAVMVFARK